MRITYNYKLAIASYTSYTIYKLVKAHCIQTDFLVGSVPFSRYRKPFYRVSTFRDGNLFLTYIDIQFCIQ